MTEKHVSAYPDAPAWELNCAYMESGLKAGAAFIEKSAEEKSDSGLEHE